jgi:hypothetical protein
MIEQVGGTLPIPRRAVAAAPETLQDRKIDGATPAKRRAIRSASKPLRKRWPIQATLSFDGQRRETADHEERG